MQVSDNKIFCIVSLCYKRWLVVSEFYISINQKTTTLLIKTEYIIALYGIRMADFSPSIGSIDGIRIELHWTFLMLLIIILFLSLYLFVLWILLFVCVLIHELFHSITSKRNGIKVKKIVLYPFGGGSIIDFENVSPDLEFRISLVGPIASLLLAVVFGIANIYAPGGIIGTTLQELFILNIFLGVFNILPWLPLDGGRALRSYLQQTRSFLDATRTAVKSSNLITVLFVIGTIAYAVLAHGYSATYREFIVLIDVVIALFIYSGAQAEMQSALLRENTMDLRVKDAITRNYFVVNEGTKVAELYKTILKKKTNIILFKKEGKVQIVSNVLLQKLLKNPTPDGRVGVFGVPIPNFQYNKNLYWAVEHMRLENVNIAVVMRGNQIYGVLLMQHIESVMALHASQKVKPRKAQ